MLEFGRPLSYLSLPLRWNFNGNAITVCAYVNVYRFTTERITIFQIYNSMNCTSIARFDLNTNHMYLNLGLSNQQHVFPKRIFSNLPSAVCLRWRNMDQEWSLTVRKTTSKTFGPTTHLSPATTSVNIGGPLIKKDDAGNGACSTDMTLPTSRMFNGDVSYVMLYNRYLSDVEVDNYTSLKWTNDGSVLYTMNDFKDDISLYGIGNLTREQFPVPGM